MNNSNNTLNTTTPNSQNELQWETPVLYREDWMNTLGGVDPTAEIPFSGTPGS